MLEKADEVNCFHKVAFLTPKAECAGKDINIWIAL